MTEVMHEISFGTKAMSQCCSSCASHVAALCAEARLKSRSMKLESLNLRPLHLGASVGFTVQGLGFGSLR